MKRAGVFREVGLNGDARDRPLGAVALRVDELEHASDQVDLGFPVHDLLQKIPDDSTDRL